MALGLTKKKEIVSEVNSIAAKAYSVIAAKYQGLTVSEMTKLRTEARKNGVELRVVRNTLARLGFSGTPYEGMRDSLVGPVVLAFAKDEPGAAARVIKAFCKDHEKMVVQAVAVSGKVLPVSDIEALAKLPTKEQAISTLLAVMQAPIAKFVRTVAAPKQKLVYALMAVRFQKAQSTQ